MVKQVGGQYVRFGVNLADETIVRIATAGDVKFTDTQKQELRHIANSYDMRSRTWRQSPRPKAVRQELEKVWKHAHRLASTLAALDPIGAKNTNPAAWEKLWIPKTGDVGQLTKRIAALAKAAEDGIAGLPDDPGGNPGNPAFEKLVSDVHALYLSSGGKGLGVTWNNYDDCYSGRFMSLIEAFTEALGESRTNLGLGRALFRALKHSSDEGQNST